MKPGKWVTYSVGAFIGVGIADIGYVLGVDHGLVLPAAAGKDIVDLPVAQDVVADFVAGGKSPPWANRDIINSVDSDPPEARSFQRNLWTLWGCTHPAR